jgi:hypothetical protein
LQSLYQYILSLLPRPHSSLLPPLSKIPFQNLQYLPPTIHGAIPRLAKPNSGRLIISQKIDAHPFPAL